jgi:hypothetical protein
MTEDTRELKEKLDKLTHEIIALKSLLIYRTQSGSDKNILAWQDLMDAREEISEKWSGPSVVQEIRAQRER